MRHPFLPADLSRANSLPTHPAADTVAPQVASYLTKLNDAQREAVEFGADAPDAPAGPLLVIAGAGSGKTNTLAHRVAHLLVKGADPHRILLLTFSRRAAIEMTRRVTRIAIGALGSASAIAQGLTWSGTFHSVGARLLRDYADLVGLSPSFTINDREDSADLMNLVRHELGLSAKEKRFPAKSTCFAIYSRVVNTGASLADRARPGVSVVPRMGGGLAPPLRRVRQRQAAAERARLRRPAALLVASRRRAGDRRRSVGRFDHVLVDEYQDTNRLQASILLSMKPDGRGLTVVGDDAQSIYSFRGATVRNILDFPNHFDPPAKLRHARAQLPLDAADSGGIECGDRARHRTLHEEPLDRQGIGSNARVSCRSRMKPIRRAMSSSRCWKRAKRGMTLKSQAVLFRAAHHSAALEIELTRRNIPFVKFGGLKFLDSVHVKDVLAVLRWAENPRDRVAGFPRRATAAGRRAGHCRARARSGRVERGDTPRALASFAARRPARAKTGRSSSR